MAWEVFADVVIDSLVEDTVVETVGTTILEDQVAGYGADVVSGTVVGSGYAASTLLEGAINLGKNLAANYLFSQALQALFPAKKGGAAGLSGGVQAQAALVTSISNVAAIPVIYGSRRVGGTLVLMEVS